RPASHNNNGGNPMLNIRTLTSIPVLAGVFLALAACSDAVDTPRDVGATAPSCDRQCLLDATDAYVAALVAHDPSRAPLADDLVFVENVTRMQPGEGLWQSIVSAPGNFVIHVPDEINQTVGYLAMMTYMAAPLGPQGLSLEEREEYAASNAPVEQPVIVAFRLQFDDSGRITEAEHLLSGVREAQLANLQTPRPGIFTEIPENRRLAHAELIAIGESYYDALDDNNGDLTPFSPDCQRHENGMMTASPEPATSAPIVPGAAPTPGVARDCREQLNSGTFQYIDRIENRRVFAADPQTGLVMGLSHFRHPMDNLPYEV